MQPSSSERSGRSHAHGAQYRPKRPSNITTGTRRPAVFAKAHLPRQVMGLRLQARTHKTLTVQWDAVDAHGGVTVKSYELQWRIYQAEGEQPWKTAGAGIRGKVCRKCNLLAATEYQFRVRANNRFGWGAYSQPSVFITEADAPDRVYIEDLSSDSSTSAVLTWKEPRTNGAPIKCYELQLRLPPSLSWSVASSSLTNRTCRKKNLTK